MAEGRVNRLMVFMPPGGAKALALDTPIPTPSGWTTMGELRVGDRVFDERGQPCDVTWVSPVWRDRPCYSVRTDCGDEVVADRDHEWLVRLCGKREVYKIKETHTLCRKRSKRAMVRRAGGLELPAVELPIDPYLLGVWLGDGSSDSLRITSSLEDQPWLRGELERLGYRTGGTSVPTLFSVLGVRDKFVSLGLINDPHHNTYGRKHVPAIYMRGSREQRLSLLQGLVDTDGTVCRKRGQVTFCNTRIELAQAVRELARSLGVKAGWVEGRATLEGRDCGPVYRVSFYLAGAARMPRKADLCRDQYRTPHTYIEVTPTEPRDTVCIEVNSLSHLFLCGRSMTPTHNSTYGSVHFPAFFLAQKRGLRVIGASNTADLAYSFSRKVRLLVQQKADLLGYDLGREAEELWTTTNDGEYKAAGVGGVITGSRADLGIIDDPVKGRKDADSEVNQKAVWDWYWGDFHSRLKPGARQVLIMTRWAEGDLGGRLLEAEGDKWDILRLPAQAEDDDPLGRAPGEFLWSDDEYGFGAKLREDRESLIKAGRLRDWNALYQQRPTSEEGTYFKSEWLRPQAKVPDRARLRVYGASDYAVSEGKGDYTAHVVVGLDPEARLWLLDVWRQKAASDRWVEAFCDLVKRWKPIGWAEEGGQIKSGVGPFLVREMREREAFVARTQFPTRGDKSIRAQSIRGRMAMGGLYYDAAAPWRGDLEHEILGFPALKHDDQVDALGLAGQLLDTMVAGEAASGLKVLARDRWAAAFAKARQIDAAGTGWKAI